MTALRVRVRHQGRLARIRGMDVESIEHSATVSRVPGSPFGMALVRGQIIPVLKLGDVDGCLIVGRVRSEIVGIAGLEVAGFDLLRDDAEQPSNTGAAEEIVAADSQGFLTLSSDEANEEYEFDIDACIARARTVQRHPAQPSEEST